MPSAQLPRGSVTPSWVYSIPEEPRCCSYAVPVSRMGDEDSIAVTLDTFFTTVSEATQRNFRTPSQQVLGI